LDFNEKIYLCFLWMVSQDPSFSFVHILVLALFSRFLFLDRAP
jgi:hypothetical protein